MLKTWLTFLVLSIPIHNHANWTDLFWQMKVYLNPQTARQTLGTVVIIIIIISSSIIVAV
jgi:hypothetical protein